jgi:hypothetical protein
MTRGVQSRKPRNLGLQFRDALLRHPKLIPRLLLSLFFPPLIGCDSTRLDGIRMMLLAVAIFPDFAGALARVPRIPHDRRFALCIVHFMPPDSDFEQRHAR